MKRKLALLLVVCMALQLSAGPVYAAGEEQAAGTEKVETDVDKKDSEPVSGKEEESSVSEKKDGETADDGKGAEIEEALPKEKAEAPGTPEDGINEKDVEENTEQKGNLSVEMTCGLPIGNIDVRFEKAEAVLTMGTGEVARQNFTSRDGRASVEMTGILAGTYSLRITGGGFSYSQDIEIQAMNQQIKLSDMTAVINQEEAHPGTYSYGDVDGNGTVDDTDRSVLLEAISAEDNKAECDLNGDGAVGLDDLQCFSYSYGKESIKASVTRTLIVDKENVEAAVGEGTVLKEGGSVADVLTGEGQISVAPASGKEISKENPVEISIDLADKPIAGGITIAPSKDSKNIIKDGTITIEYTDGDNDKTENVSISKSAYYRSASTAAVVTQEPDGTLVVDLGSQVAVKKITIKVTDTGSTKLADISKVEFLNDMESRIPAPVMNIPGKLAAEPGNKKFTVTWEAQTNVSGYEVEITHGDKTIVMPAALNRILVSSFGQDKLKNKETYKVRVQSVNGEWSSGYSEVIDVVPEADKAPDPPENVTVNGGYRLLDISWKKMEDTDYYTLYYRAKGETQYQKVDKITKTSYRLTDLKNKTDYELYLTGTNDRGTSRNSTVYTGTTMDLDPAVTPNYKLINTDNGVGNATAHVTGVEYPSPSTKPEKELAVVDNDYTSIWKIDSWDAGGYNDGKPSPVVAFDQAYEMDRIVIVPDSAQQGTYAYVKTRYWDESGNVHMVDGQIRSKTSSNGKVYYEFQSDKPFTAKKVQVNLAQYWAGIKNVTIAEMKFYYYDSLEADVNALYSDALHVTLADGVDEKMIDALEERANTKDEVSGEYHPRREIILREIENARKILENENLTAPIQIDTNIVKSKDNALGMASGLNSWQPLGITAHEGEELTVFVGRENTAIGGNTQVRLIATQYHAESSSWNKVIVSNLKQGQNIVTIPKISSLNTEHGGSLYVEYTNANQKPNIQVRVSGGTKIPMLDISKATSADEKKAAISAYVKELNEYVPKIEEKHNSLHLDKDDSHCNYKYKKEDCILGVTDIVLDKMMYSVSSEQILAGVKKAGTSIEAQTEALYQSLEAMDQMVTLFYQHKGLSDKANPEKHGTKNSLPVSRLNIRYMRMFSGAFMYAGGLHIGIEWGSIPGLTTSSPVVSNNGKYESGRLFGWGIAHEIGHIINQPDYAIAEITNNYFSILAQADETNEKVRFKYPDVYEKVTSGTTGKADSVFTSLAMYWQLHLAYDNGYNYKTYDDYESQFNNLFFARVDAYARNTSIAPKGLSLSGADTDNKLMRLSCAAAEKNLLDFFVKWGMVPDEATKAYASQFEAETRNICYISDEARAYRIEGGSGAASSAQVEAEMKHEKNSKQVTLKLSNTAQNQGAMLGYEIYRNGKVVGFVEAGEGVTEYTDTIATVNNRVFTYEVVGYDKLLNTTEKLTLNPVKISHDGSVSKEFWSVTTNMTSDKDVREEGSDDNPEPEAVSAIDTVYNDDYNDSYTGTAKNEPELVIDFNETLAVAGMKITASKENEADVVKKYEVYVSNDKSEWTLAKSGTLSYNSGEAVVYFSKESDSWMYTYDAAYLKLVVKGQKTAQISEIDILGPAGDNVELLEDGIGILKSDYVYDKKDGKIPAGSLIFTGEYKGNPAYNAIKLYDQDGNIIEGSQLIFADVPEKGELGEISSGTWIYYIEAKDLANVKQPSSVRAELYRVDDAHTNEGERLVSDTLSVEVPEVLPGIEIKGGK